MAETNSSSDAAAHDDDYDYIFGFGSIINTTTHGPWLADVSSDSKALPGQPARILASFGYKRGWNFRSNTGFTALGITKDETGGANINGVLFRITHDMLPGFDRREVGYDRVEIRMDDLELLPQGHEDVDELKGRVWVYIPQEASYAEANEDHPILQSYVDCVMQGCLEWGGEPMAMEFVATTSNWSPYYLNDTPSSRRPWLFRKEYNTIDRILSQNPVTHFADRRHPEEFASAFLIKMMRGAWSVPRRNPVFTGRDTEIGQIHARLTAQRTEQSLLSSVAKLEVVGMGGVGKTQICTEYCYRYFPSYYGLVIWLRATSAESIAADYRQLMADTTGADVKEKDTDEVVAEVKARLFRSKVPWLLVFDNLEDQCLLEKFVPNGGTGHVLVTTRLVSTDDIEFGDQTLMLGCFDPSESVELLCRSAGQQNIQGETQVNAANKLADLLGHLPLALGMAAAYMRRCDVDSSEYLDRYVSSEMRGAHLGHEAVASSLSLSLDAIKAENMIAWEALRLLGWLGPDQITKKLLRSLLSAKNAHSQETLHAVNTPRTGRDPASQIPLIAGGLVAFTFLAIGNKVTTRTQKGVGRLALLSISATAIFIFCSRGKVQALLSEEKEPQVVAPIIRKASFSADVFEQTDQTWKILKSYSLLSVKEGKGSMHRLLAQSLRISQDEQESRYNLEICLKAMLQAWSFKPEQVETWQESMAVLEHVKSAVMYSAEWGVLKVESAVLSKEAGVFSAMALNRFEEAQDSLDQSLCILDGLDQTDAVCLEARASALHELGRVFRYQGRFRESEDALRKALDIRKSLAKRNFDARHGVAATLYELGVLEVKKHNLDSAASFLQQALDLRRVLEVESPVEGIEADCASTLHQLAAVQVALKPPSLDKAESLLNEALGLNMQIGQRAATLKQLARVAIRRGEFDVAQRSLAQALELYEEIYGLGALHINVAAVKYQQGSLAFQREQHEQAWLHFSECLRARRHVYAYSQGNHLEVSSVLHELGCVAFTQKRFSTACEQFSAEKAILDQLCDTSGQRQRLLQARLTNLTWLRKCAKERGDEKETRRLSAELSSLKRKERQQSSVISKSSNPQNVSLARELLRCRSVARQFALGKPDNEDRNSLELNAALTSLSKEISKTPPCKMQEAALNFQQMISHSLAYPDERSVILEACDDLREILRDHGLEVSDTVQQNSCSRLDLVANSSWAPIESAVAGAVLATMIEHRDDMSPKKSDTHAVRLAKTMCLFLLLFSFGLEIISFFVTTVTGTMLFSHGDTPGALENLDFNSRMGFVKPNWEFEYLTGRVAFLQGLFHWLASVAMELLIPKNGGVAARRMNKFASSAPVTILVTMLSFLNRHMPFYKNYADMLCRNTIVCFQRFIWLRQPLTILLLPLTLATAVLGFRAFTTPAEAEKE